MNWEQHWQQLASYIGGTENWWMVQVFFVVLVTVIANFVVRVVLRRIANKFAKTKNPWDDALVEAAIRPATWLVWLLGISWAAEVIHNVTEATIFSVVDSARQLGVITLLGWFLVGLIKNVQENLLNPAYASKPVDTQTVIAVSKLLRITVIITAVLVAMQSLGYSVSGILAFGGIGGLAVGFAAKDLLANFFGGLMIYLDRPFAIGDWVRSPDQEIEGTVEDIGWRLTRIRTFDKRPLYVPNATFTQISLENPSRMFNRRIFETIGIRYADGAKMEAIVNDVKDFLQNYDAIDTDQTLMVNFNQFGPSSLDFFIYTFTKTTVWTEYHEIKQQVLLKIMAIIDGHGAEIAFPTRTLHIADVVHTESAGA